MEFEYITQAMHNEPIPESCVTLTDRYCYMALRFLACHFKAGYISKELAGVEKRKALQAWEVGKTGDALTLHHAEVIKATANAINAYRKNRTLENADKMAEAFQGVEVKEKDGI